MEDEEDIHLKNILWKGNVPTNDIENCERHALRLGFKINFDEAPQVAENGTKEEQLKANPQQNPPKMNEQLLANLASEPDDAAAVGSGTTSSEAGEDEPPINLFPTTDGEMVS